ncbi:hypothetical protein HA402_011920, partial [Bradysia odoriphaga]
MAVWPVSRHADLAAITEKRVITFSDTIPQIDCSAIVDDFENLDLDKLYCIAQKFGTAMTGIGMCYLINQGLDMKKSYGIFLVSGKLPNAEIPSFQMAFDDIRSDLENIVKVLLRCIEIYLNLERDFLISSHKNLGNRTILTHTQMRSLYYGAINSNEPLPTTATRFGEHKDFGTLTFVIQDQVGE